MSRSPKASDLAKAMPATRNAAIMLNRFAGMIVGTSGVLTDLSPFYGISPGPKITAIPNYFTNFEKLRKNHQLIAPFAPRSLSRADTIGKGGVHFLYVVDPATGDFYLYKMYPDLARLNKSIAGLKNKSKNIENCGGTINRGLKIVIVQHDSGKQYSGTLDGYSKDYFKNL